MKYVLLDDNGDTVLKMKFMCEVATFLFSLYLYKLYRHPYFHYLSIENFIVVFLLHCPSIPPSPSHIPHVIAHAFSIVYTALILWNLTEYDGYKELKESFSGISKGDTQLATEFTRTVGCPKFCFISFAAKNSVISYET